MDPEIAKLVWQAKEFAKKALQTGKEADLKAALELFQKVVRLRKKKN